MSRTMVLAGLLATLWLTAPAEAQMIDTDAIRRQAEEKSGEFAELRALLRDEDVNLRLAAFDAMVAHGDPSLYEIAVSTAIADIDEVIRARALWEVLSRMRTLNIDVDPEDTLKGDAAETVEGFWQGRMNFSVGNTVREANCINLYYDRPECIAQHSLSVNGTRVGFSYASQQLDGVMRLESDGILRGTFRHTRSKIEFPVAMTLR